MSQDRSAEMGRMARTLNVDGLLQGDRRAEAAERCAECSKREICRDWLEITAIRGADHAPDFCLNADVFADLASEARAGIF